MALLSNQDLMDYHAWITTTAVCSATNSPVSDTTRCRCVGFKPNQISIHVHSILLYPMKIFQKLPWKSIESHEFSPSIPSHRPMKSPYVQSKILPPIGICWCSPEVAKKLSLTHRDLSDHAAPILGEKTTKRRRLGTLQWEAPDPETKGMVIVENHRNMML